ncbi:MAG: SGNH hydrolase domain-containing protein, partial [Microbacterium sp.]
LWHWTAIVIAVALLGGPMNPVAALAVVVATLVLSWLTKRGIEDPVRRAPGVLRRSGPTFALTAAGIAVMLVLTVVPLRLAHEHADRYEAGVAPEIADTAGCFGAYALRNDCADPYAVGAGVDPLATQFGYLSRRADPAHCTQETVEGQQEVRCRTDGTGPRVVLLGDSHAEHLIEPMLRVAEREGWRLAVRTRGGCSGLEDPDAGPAAVSRRCAEWEEEVRREVVSDPGIDLVVVSLRPVTKKAATDFAAERLAEFAENGRRVVLIRDVPGTEFANVPGRTAETGPECVAESPGRDDPCSYPDRSRPDWAVDAAVRAGAALIDTHEVLCPEGVCHVVIGDTIVYGDSNHLAVPFAKTLAPWLADRLRPLAVG